MNQLIIDAIEERLLLKFNYKGKARLVEPHTYGRQHNGNESLSAWQLSGGSGQDFRLFTLGDMDGIEIEAESFESERPAYQKGDQRYSQIYAEL
ncbi:WYL domain-containing protein [Citromicrobium sp. WPS32]|uniref:WYL domain-containing protein n=1 Tax=Citromicrobium sp. WPS32 TaxID=1634517 RepID=UPI0006C8EDC0|nr:WYL domain-containing protein [Citromicrobium sp. WPS32]KPM12341.1 hypothetical protein WG75_14910 [Citromicrobium sp. WPS32]MAY77419.1 hypothetical protein [Citromicrobium sp.]|tara:strand:+ start:3576 stop:3857 length:282 start_codon:yes stop_codon:yes gene_type:complete